MLDKEEKIFISKKLLKKLSDSDVQGVSLHDDINSSDLIFIDQHEDEQDTFVPRETDHKLVYVFDDVFSFKKNKEFNSFEYCSFEFFKERITDANKNVVSRFDFSETIHILTLSSMGFYTDIVVSKVNEVEQNPFRIRTYLNSLFSLLDSFYKNKKMSLPVDLHFGFVDSAMNLQLVIPFFEVPKTKIIEDLTSFPERPEIMDLSYWESQDQLVLTFVFENAATDLKQVVFDCSGARNAQNLLGKPRELVVYPDTSLSESQEIKISGDHVILIKRVIDFIRKAKKDESLESLNKDDVESLIHLYPDKKLVEQITESDKEYILKCLHSRGALEKLTDDYEKVINSTPEEEFIQRVSGKFDNLGLDEITQVVRGERQDLTQEKWEIKKALVKGKVEEEIKETSSQQNKPSTSKLKDRIERKIEAAILDEMEVSEDEAQGIASHIVDTSLRQDYKVDEKKSTEDLREDLLRREVEKLKNENSVEKSRVKRMFRLINTLKEQVMKLKEVGETQKNINTSSSFEGTDYEIVQLKSELSKVKGELDSRNELIDKMQKGQKNEIEKKNQEIKRLNESLSEMNYEYRLKDGSPTQKIIELEQQKERLTSQLEAIQERMDTLNINFEKRIKETKDKTAVEIKSLRDKLLDETKKVKQLEYENLSLTKKVSSIEQVEDKSDTHVEKSSSEHSKEGHLKIQELNKKIQSQNTQMKALGLRVKQYEHKNKLLNAQLASYGTEDYRNEKKNSRTDSRTVETEAQLKHKLSQLEISNKRFEKALQKTGGDLAQKKKEVVHLTQQVNTLKKKLEEAEKKANMKAAS